MEILTTVNNSGKGVKMMLQKLEKEEIVIIPLSRYEALLQQMEDLQDQENHYKAMEDYRQGEGRAFREFIAEQGGKFDLQG
ncbi:MAG: hypothetical protein AAB267_05770 [Candidatus Desantisbacteria bacterium]